MSTYLTFYEIDENSGEFITTNEIPPKGIPYIKEKKFYKELNETKFKKFHNIEDYKLYSFSYFLRGREVTFIHPETNEKLTFRVFDDSEFMITKDYTQYQIYVNEIDEANVTGLISYPEWDWVYTQKDFNKLYNEIDTKYGSLDYMKHKINLWDFVEGKTLITIG